MNEYEKRIAKIENDVSEIKHDIKMLIDVVCKNEKYNDLVGVIEENFSSYMNNYLDRESRLITTAFLHQDTFKKYKNINSGRSVALVGAGPSVNNFKAIDGDICYIGLNRAFLKKDILFDYLFAIDIAGISFCVEDFIKYRDEDCVKFVGDQNNGLNWQIPESYLKEKNVLRYKTTAGFKEDKFALDIDVQPLGNFSSVAFQALQFALYTNPDKIYLVGMDCNVAQKGHFISKEKTIDPQVRGQDLKLVDEVNINTWLAVKDFVEIYYPQTEIISINPVGLKGIFTDINQNE